MPYPPQDDTWAWERLIVANLVRGYKSLTQSPQSMEAETSRTSRTSRELKNLPASSAVISAII